MAKDSYLVLDTGVWLYDTRLLSTTLGAAILFFLRQSGHILAVPEVIEKEIKKNIRKQGTQYIENIRDAYRFIEQVMGERDDYRVPTSDEFVQRVESRFSELGGLLYRVDFNFEHAKSALDKIVDDLPPNSEKNQQFKDCLVWEAILELAKKDDVYFVTKDKGFFENRNPDNGLAKNLKLEAESVCGDIKIFYMLSPYLDSVVKVFSGFNESELVEDINALVVPDLIDRYSQRDCHLEGMISGDVKSFLTENHDIIAVEFSLKYAASGFDYRNEELFEDAYVIVEGGCAYNLPARNVSDIQYESIRMYLSDGKEIPEYGTVFLTVGSTYTGRRAVSNRFRHPIGSWDVNE